MMQNHGSMMPGYAPLGEGTTAGPQPMMPPCPDWKPNSQMMGTECTGMMGASTMGNGTGPSAMMSQVRNLAAQNSMMVGFNAASGGYGTSPHASISSQHQNQMLYMHLMQQQQQQARIQAHQQQQLLLQQQLLQVQQQQQQCMAGPVPPSQRSTGEDSVAYQNHMHLASLARNDIVSEPSKYRPGTFMESDLVHMHTSASTEARHLHSEDGLPDILRHLTMSPSHTDMSNTSTVLPNSAPISEASFSSITVSMQHA
jgi:hypothetical protein